MRDIPASIEAGFATDRQELARCVKLQLRDGTVLGFTDHDEDLFVDLGDGPYEVTYRADLGIVSGNIDLVIGLESSNTEISIPLLDTVSRNSALGRRYNQATVWIFDVDWSLADPVPMEIMKGWVAETRVPQNTAVLEVRSYQDYFNMVQGRILSPRCTADFGDEQCGVAVVDVPAVVTGVVSNMRFHVDLAGTLNDGHFRFGEGEFASGELSGVAPFEIFDSIGSTGLIEALAPLPDIPQFGDQVLLRQGCSKLKLYSDLSIPTCNTNNNCRRFRGFDRVPGTDVYIRSPIPGEG